MFTKMIATMALGGSLVLGGATAASASTSTGATSTSGSTPAATTTYNCANAPKALSRIAKLESKEQSFVTKATAREAAATKDGHTKAAKVIARRISAVQKREARGTKLEQKIQSACPASSAS